MKDDEQRRNRGFKIRRYKSCVEVFSLKEAISDSSILVRTSLSSSCDICAQQLCLNPSLAINFEKESDDANNDDDVTEIRTTMMKRLRGLKYFARCVCIFADSIRISYLTT
ncbi:hypothetical protein PIB30_021474 [Stylosanthes scabra]|uniref:Uncharacterized protein n=1 Tax=Stylosanthes scabra TaxID=79078 RepID=A0ABU6XAL8_9FABA|nr:hypothetical protein [Stylosanthes scabra]